jgi:hypothetical protein
MFMNQRYKTIRREIDKEAERRKYTTDAEGRVVIPLVIDDDSDFLSVFSESAIPVISTDVADYLEEKTSSLPPHQPLTLKIRSNCIDPEEQNTYKEAIREHYFVRYLICKRELRRNALLTAFLAITGMLMLLISYFIDAQWGNLFWTEVADIVAWVFVWESVDVFAFRNHELRIERLHCLSFMSMKVDFMKE